MRDGLVEGGSTITQLAKNTATGPARAIERKVAEASVAWQLAQQLSKDEILARYLNSAYFGNGGYGIEFAAREYFGVHADELDLPLAALLARMLRSPARYDPTAIGRRPATGRDVVLRLMRDQDRIAHADARAAMQRPVEAGAPRRRRWKAARTSSTMSSTSCSTTPTPPSSAAPALRAQRVVAGDLRDGRRWIRRGRTPPSTRSTARCRGGGTGTTRWWRSTPRPVASGRSPTCTGAVERDGQVWEHVPSAGATVESGDDVLLHASDRRPEGRPAVRGVRTDGRRYTTRGARGLRR